jgi:hypothetical protein
MQKLSACRNRFSEIQRRRSTSSSCMIAICPAGPPKLMHPSLNQKRNASRSVGNASPGAAARASTAASGAGAGSRCAVVTRALFRA